MKIIHTADWHLGARLNRVPRAGDLERAVEGVLALCERHEVEVLLIAGDLFDGDCRHRPEDLCGAIDHLKDAARPFLRGGGTILALTGNHDKETLCDTLRHAQSLADPTPIGHGDRIASGRFHLVTRPTFVRLADRLGQEVQFALLPYPTPRLYLDGEETPYGPGAEPKNRLLLDGVRSKLAKIRGHRAFDPGLHSVLAAHLHVTGAKLPGGHAAGEKDGVILPPDDLDAGWAYVALGHVHGPQAVAGLDHVRYSGSIERLRIDEADDKEVILVEIGPGGLAGPPTRLPLDATRFLRIDIPPDRPDERLREYHTNEPEPDRTLVHCRMRYEPGEDDPDGLRERLFALFPRCYDWEITPAGTPASDPPSPGPGPLDGDPRSIVLEYLRSRLGDDDASRPVLSAAQSLIEEVWS